jgi:hypothetical protein
MPVEEHQNRKWRREGARLIVVLDANEHTMDGNLKQTLEPGGVVLIEFFYKS